MSLLLGFDRSSRQHPYISQIVLEPLVLPNCMAQVAERLAPEPRPVTELFLALSPIQNCQSFKSPDKWIRELFEN